MKKIFLPMAALLLLVATFASAQNAPIMAGDPAFGFTVTEDGVIRFENPSPAPITAEDFAGGADATPFEPRNIMQFETMVGLPRSVAGSTAATRGVPPAGAPWDIGPVDGEVNDDGTVEITVQGLVLTDTGANPAAEFRAVVSCEGLDGNVSTVMTRTFPADAGGNALIDDQVALPSPCLAPVVFITNAGGNWFAVTGASGDEMAAGIR